jgi:hypothetical protein
MSEWISVKDRVPEDCLEKVLIHVVPKIGRPYVAVDCFGGFFVIDGIDGEDITHWMPLPDPPKV